MPPRRNYFTRRTPYNPIYGAGVGRTTRQYPNVYRRPSTARRYRGPGGFRRVMNLQRQIIQMSEKKYLDRCTQDGAIPLVDALGFIIGIGDVPAGTTDTSRIGDKIVMNSIELNYEFYMDPNVPSIDWLQMTVRVIVFLWKDDTNPDVNDILQLTTAGATNLDFAKYLSAYNHDKKVKRKILYDQVLSVPNGLVYNYSASLTVSQGNAIYNKKVFIDLTKYTVAKRTISYMAGTTDGVNKPYVLVIGGFPAGVSTANKPRFLHWARLNYTDS